MSHPTIAARRTITRIVAVGALAATAFGAAACSSSTTPSASGSSTAKAEAGSALDLSTACPATVVMQQDWQPEAEHGAMYNLVGTGYTVDTSKKSVTGPLVVNGTARA